MNFQVEKEKWRNKINTMLNSLFMFVVFEIWIVILASRSNRLNFKRLQFGDGWEECPSTMKYLSS